MSDEAARKVHEALGAYLDEGELAVGWTLTIEVLGPDNNRFLAHRAGGGLDGDDPPTIWTAVGMLKAAMTDAEEQLETYDPSADEDGEE